MKALFKNDSCNYKLSILVSSLIIALTIAGGFFFQLDGFAIIGSAEDRICTCEMCDGQTTEMSRCDCGCAGIDSAE